MAKPEKKAIIRMRLVFVSGYFNVSRIKPNDSCCLLKAASSDLTLEVQLWNGHHVELVYWKEMDPSAKNLLITKQWRLDENVQQQQPSH